LLSGRWVMCGSDLASSPGSVPHPPPPVTVVDKCPHRIRNGTPDISPHLRPGLEAIVKEARVSDSLFPHGYRCGCPQEADLIFHLLCRVRRKEIADTVKAGRKIVVEKSTVPVKAAEEHSTILYANKAPGVR
ncbi:UDP-glucose 6-dehydrogenase, partial [Caligus rogercresseyi]